MDLKKVTHEQCRAVIENQNALNCKVNPEWMQANFAFHRAIWTEAAEALGHLPWEWWKRKEGITPEISPKQMAHVRLELIDILHFGISLYLLEVPAASLEENFLSTSREMANDIRAIYVSADADGEGPRWDTDKLIVAVEALAADASYMASFEFDRLATACFWAGMSQQQIISLYNGKNALNIFRQRNGYKEGTYIKNWRSKDEDAEVVEDNEVLHSIITSDAAPDTIEGIVSYLTGYYAGVVRYAQMQKRKPAAPTQEV